LLLLFTIKAKFLGLYLGRIQQGEGFWRHSDVTWQLD